MINKIIFLVFFSFNLNIERFLNQATFTWEGKWLQKSLIFWKTETKWDYA